MTTQTRTRTIDLSSAAGIRWQFQPEGGDGGDIRTPAGGWRTQGHTCDAGIYRAEIPIPAEAADHVVRVASAAVNFGAEVFVQLDSGCSLKVAEPVTGRVDRVLLAVVNTGDKQVDAVLDIDLAKLNLTPRSPWQEVVRVRDFPPGMTDRNSTMPVVWNDAPITLDFYARQLTIKALQPKTMRLIGIRRY